jgi:hypothetical protein
MTEVNRQEIAKRFGLPEQLAGRLIGTTAEEVEADARALSEAIGVEGEAEHVRLARRALEAAESNPNRGELAALADDKAERNRRILGSLHLTEDEGKETPEPTGRVNFDGGAREPAIEPGDPVQEFNAIALEMLRARELGGW